MPILLIRLLTAQTLKLFTKRARLGFGGLPCRLFRHPRFPLFAGMRLRRISAYLRRVCARLRHQTSSPLYHNALYRRIRLRIQYVEAIVGVPIEAQSQQLAVGSNRTVRSNLNIIRLIGSVNQTLARNRLSVQLAARGVETPVFGYL